MYTSFVLDHKLLIGSNYVFTESINKRKGKEKYQIIFRNGGKVLEQPSFWNLKKNQHSAIQQNKFDLTTDLTPFPGGQHKTCKIYVHTDELALAHATPTNIYNKSHGLVHSQQIQHRNLLFQNLMPSLFLIDSHFGFASKCTSVLD